MTILDVENETSSFNNSEIVENITTSLASGMNKTFDSAKLFEYNSEGNRSSGENESSRVPRQELNDTKSDPEFESQEEGSSEEEGNMVTGLISAFLGGLSRVGMHINTEKSIANYK